MRLKLSTNMRVTLHGDVAAGAFSVKLLQIGKGDLETCPEDGLDIVPCGNNVTTADELKENVFPNIPANYRNHSWLCERAILAPKNDAVDKINLDLLQTIPGDLRTYRSVDSIQNDHETVHYPVEFLNSLQPPGVPPHILHLKEGAPIMLLRNIDPPKLCNGTRLAIKKLMPHVIEANILTGNYSGEQVFIPRIPIIPSDLPFEFKRLQFPVRLSFAMTINKAQGQSLKVVGLNLDSPCFSHGQLYVGCSRVGQENNLYILSEQGKTKNIVYKEALHN
uniref:ATP-dependent DNA helicase PIF1-like n=1 Tax=Myxine glutinosa TaxID=7769 RepID=UPI00358E7B8D